MKAHILRVIFTIIFGTKPCYSQTIVKMQHGYGLMSYGREILIQDCQSIEKIKIKGVNAFIIMKNGRFAVVAVGGGYYNDNVYTMYSDTSGERAENNDWNKITFEYDEIKTIDSRNYEVDFVVRKNNKYGAINLWNEITLPVKYDSIFSTKAQVFLTIAKKDGKYAVVPNNLAGEFSSNMLSFDFDEVSPQNKGTSSVRLKKGDHYAVACYVNKEDVLISPPIFDSIGVDPYDYVFVHAFKADTTFLLYGLKNISGNNISFSTLDLKDKTVFYNLYNNRQMSADLYPRKYNVRVFYPNAFFSEEGSPDFSIINLEESKVVALENESDIKQLMLNGDEYYYRPEEQFAIQNKVLEDFSYVTILYAMKNYQPIFSYSLNPKEETLYLEIYEKDRQYIKVSRENLENHKKKTLGYIDYGGEYAIFLEQKPDEQSVSYSTGHIRGGGRNWMDFFWMGGR